MDLGLKGRTVIVTGATGGIGREIARGYAAEGADVVLTHRDTPGEAGKLAEEVGGLALPYEMGDPASAAALVTGALERTGRIDVLVNNAVRWGGRAPRPDASFEDVADDEWLETIRHNIEGALRLSRLAAPVMRERGFGRLVHVSSGIVTEGMAGGEYYGAAKGALHGFSRSAAFSLGRDGDILSNVVMPGFTRTARNGEMAAAVGHRYSARAPIGRLLDAAEVANAVVYLGSAANTGITGQVIAVTGGV
ncbi:beta-ketoacyl-ACP reductase [Planobispora rosea]|uniref:Beta-ketoacyl-ACP reductase n=1 Tax=Planobispora rosea TaxID=35762 RepID=A0A8J3S687_PLARO|nr:SDR family NAD(P)-dependent oxidoreductase [Planobispora rosea]GGS95670.1 beta-ketoacyl-ACP reductase [Planobispora rosea]GIH87495.1 beta-ketoacyl-ACP reductase [Planobispora rosea]